MLEDVLGRELDVGGRLTFPSDSRSALNAFCGLIFILSLAELLWSPRRTRGHDPTRHNGLPLVEKVMSGFRVRLTIEAIGGEVRIYE